MQNLIFYIMLCLIAFYLTATTAYLIALAVAYFIVPEPQHAEIMTQNSFAVLVPAHNGRIAHSPAYRESVANRLSPKSSPDLHRGRQLQ